MIDKRYLFLFIILITLFVQCQKEQVELNTEVKFSDSSYAGMYNRQTAEERLPVSYAKLELVLGRNFIPVANRIGNIDEDVNEEFLILYKSSESEPAKLAIFDILSNEVLKKLYQFETEIRLAEGAGIQVTNLFEENDNFIVLEGKSGEDRSHLYILANRDGEFVLVKDFRASYSLFMNFDEKESTNNKYFILKDIVVINDALTATNTTVQNKDVYSWSYEERRFVNVESSQIVAAKSSELYSKVLYSPDKYFNYLKGFWYPAKYKELIDNDKIDIKYHKRENSRFVMMEEANELKEISINYGEYIEKYIIKKIVRLGGQRPGLRFILREHSYNSSRLYKYIDVYLLSSDKLRVIGPGKFQQSSYVRLDKPFIEYLDEEKSKREQEKTAALYSFLNGKIFTEFSRIESEGDVEISFLEENRFNISKNSRVESGLYRIDYEDEQYLLRMLYQTENKIIEYSYFIINIRADEELFLLTPIKVDFKSYSKIESGSYKFKEKKGDARTGG